MNLVNQIFSNICPHEVGTKQLSKAILVQAFNFDYYANNHNQSDFYITKKMEKLKQYFTVEPE